VVLCGVEHCPRAEGGVRALLIEPRDVVNTGDAGGDLTAAYNDSHGRTGTSPSHRA
jgi:hypothetical protein